MTTTTTNTQLFSNPANTNKPNRVMDIFHLSTLPKRPPVSCPLTLHPNATRRRPTQPHHIRLAPLRLRSLPPQGTFPTRPLPSRSRLQTRISQDQGHGGTALIDMYAKSGQVELARLAFREMEVKNSMTWNTLIDGYMEKGNVGDALAMFDEMPERDVDRFGQRIYEEAAD